MCPSTTLGIARLTEYNENWGLDAINAHEAYDQGYTGEDVIVAVADGGFDTDHPDLKDNMVTGYDQTDGDNDAFDIPSAKKPQDLSSIWL